MKKNGILNSNINAILGDLGHTHAITIADAGLPINNYKIDLALVNGKPSFIEVLDVIKDEMVIEEIILAEEIKNANETIYNDIIDLLEKSVKITFVTHEQFKKECDESLATIRTGEVTPYANIILKSGVTFS